MGLFSRDEDKYYITSINSRCATILKFIFINSKDPSLFYENKTNIYKLKQYGCTTALNIIFEEFSNSDDYYERKIASMISHIL